jgi:NTE family protein
VMHGRMEYGLERYRAEHPEVDILLLEPPGDDLRMFTYNIMRYSARRVVAEHGYRSVLRFFRENEKSYGDMLKRAGVGLRDPHRVPETPPGHPYRSPLARSLAVSLDRLDSRLR